MTNVRFASIDSYRDIETLNMYHERTAAGADPEDLMASIYAKGRDNARTPMQWDTTPHAGFTTATPWLALNPNYSRINAAESVADPDSVFHHYRRLIACRKSNPVMVYGHYALLDPDDTEVYAYTRTLNDDRLLVVCNFTAGTPTFSLTADVPCGAVDVLVSNYDVAAAAHPRSIQLRPYEAIVWWLRRPVDRSP
jgi:oligo-1,6-glucosidase